VLKDKNPPEYFKAKNFIGVSLMNKGKTKDAHKVFDELMQKVTLHYGFKHEGIPLVHDIYRNMANCKTQLNQYKDALTLLNSTKSWQQGCEGSRSPNLVVT
jgi:tetratricopeptide (TPR) repeat protein